MSKVHDLIMKILDDPERYIGRSSVQRLHLFISAYCQGHPLVDYQSCMGGFNEYIAECYDIHISKNWADIIELFADSEREELELFKKHYAEYAKINHEFYVNKHTKLDTITQTLPPTEPVATKLYDLLMAIYERPGVYIGRYSIHRLYVFIAGFLYENDAADDHCMDGFQEYVSERYQITSNRTWADILAFHSWTESEEIEVFKKEFFAFIGQRDRMA